MSTIQDLLDADDLEGARGACEATGSAEGWWRLSIALEKRDTLDEALAAANRGLAIEESASLHYQRGVVLEALRRPADALAAYVAATDTDPTHAWAWINRGRQEDDAGRHADAIVSYDRALALDPKDEIGWSNRGNSALSLGHFTEALASFDRSLALADSPQARLGKASTLVELGQIEAANTANPAGTPFDRGTAIEMAEPLPDGRRLVLRYRTERHSRPEWLRGEAENILRTCVPLRDRPPGLGAGVRIQILFVPFQIRADGDDLVLCTPDLRDPYRFTGISTFALQALVMANLLHDMVDVAPAPASWFDTVMVEPGALRERHVVARRQGPRANGRSGWAITTGGDATEEVPIVGLLRGRPELAKPITLPVGWAVRFDGHAVVSVTDPTGQERWG